MALVQRAISVIFTLAQGTFAESGTNQVTLSGLRISSKIIKAGGRSMGTAQLQIYGMTLSLMNQLSTLGMQIQVVPRNQVTVLAGDVNSVPATIFQGTITNAWADFQAAPEVGFHVESHTGLAAAVIPTVPSSFRGPTSVATVMSGLAVQMGLAFENNGITSVLQSPYFWGSARNQAQACVDAAGIAWNGGDDGVLAIWPQNGARGGLIPLVSADTGMIGYPTYTAQGILLKTLFNPSISFGSKIQVQSILTPACGTWAVFGLDHELDAQVPHGKWASTIQAYNPAYPQPIPG